MLWCIAGRASPPATTCWRWNMLVFKELRFFPARGASGPPTPKGRWQPSRKTHKPRDARRGGTLVPPANLHVSVSVQRAMKTMTHGALYRCLFMVAILAGLAATPDAQTFRWEP